MIDVQGTSLNGEDKEVLAHPLIAVDHEGGRVQRFRDGYAKIPAMADIWQASKGDKTLAATMAKSTGLLMALEVIASGIDISFAPVLDVNGISDVIGDRAFHQDPSIVSLLATSFIQGMNAAGMKATGKHFPGHGSVKEDSHIALPVDKRSQQDIFEFDLLPFKQLIEQQLISAVMPAHIIFPAIDNEAVGFSRKWLQEILRQQLNFHGVIFSDDLSMEGASVVGGFVERAEAAQQAGCDMLLTCNNRDAAIDVIDNANININPQSQSRLTSMLSKSPLLGQWQSMKKQAQWQHANTELEKLLTRLN